jgi:hypothetical protein
MSNLNPITRGMNNFCEGLVNNSNQSSQVPTPVYTPAQRVYGPVSYSHTTLQLRPFGSSKIIMYDTLTKTVPSHLQPSSELEPAAEGGSD